MADPPAPDTLRTQSGRQLRATIALPVPNLGLATAALRSCLQQDLAERQGNGTHVVRQVLDWMTFVVTGPEQQEVRGLGTWHFYAATADVTTLDAG